MHLKLWSLHCCICSLATLFAALHKFYAENCNRTNLFVILETRNAAINPLQLISSANNIKLENILGIVMHHWEQRWLMSPTVVRNNGLRWHSSKYCKWNRFSLKKLHSTLKVSREVKWPLKWFTTVCVRISNDPLTCWFMWMKYKTTVH